MSHATSGTPARVVPDWRHAAIDHPAPCVLCWTPAACRSQARDMPRHKGCAEVWITSHGRSPADLARLVRRYTSSGGEQR